MEMLERGMVVLRWFSVFFLGWAFFGLTFCGCVFVCLSVCWYYELVFYLAYFFYGLVGNMMMMK